MPVSAAMSYIPQHWIVCALCSLAFAIISFKNTCFFSIADIVDSMTVQRMKPTGGCPYLFSDGPSERRVLPFYLPDVFWNPWIIDIANSAFHTGKLLTIVPAGVLSDLGYSKYVLGGGMLLVVVVQLLYPTSADLGVTVYAVQNFFEGIGEASIYPSIVSLISRWTPPSERNTFTAFVVAGLYYGEALGHVFFNLTYMGFSSWRFGQYTLGTVGLVWLALCFVFIYHSPDDSPFISEREYHTIFSRDRGMSFMFRLQRLQGIPWRIIISSRPFLSLVLVYCSLDWAVNLNVYGILDSYQTYILHLPSKFSHGSTNAMIAALPTSLMGGFLADWIIKHNLISKTVLKRTFAFISVLCPSILLMVVCCLVGCNIILFWTLSITAVYTLGLAVSVIYSSPVDLSPRHAGLLMGIMSGARTICSLFNAKIDYGLVTDPNNPGHWQVRCLFCALLAFVMIIPFLFFGSGEKQHWRRNRGPSYGDERPPVELDTSGEPNTLQSH